MTIHAAQGVESTLGPGSKRKAQSTLRQTKLRATKRSARGRQFGRQRHDLPRKPLPVSFFRHAPLEAACNGDAGGAWPGSECGCGLWRRSRAVLERTACPTREQRAAARVGAVVQARGVRAFDWRAIRSALVRIGARRPRIARDAIRLTAAAAVLQSRNRRRPGGPVQRFIGPVR